MRWPTQILAAFFLVSSCVLSAIAEPPHATENATDPDPLDAALAQFAARTQVTITGQVLDEKQHPVPGAAITIFGPEGASHLTTDEDGAYRVEHAAIGLYAIVAERPDCAVTATTRMEHKWEGVTSVLTERVTIDGIVIDSNTGRPLPEFVCAEVWDTESFRLGVPTSVREYIETRIEGAHGRFTIPVHKPRLPAVVFRAPGYQPYLVRIAQGQIGAQIGGLVVPLVPSMVVRGTVVDAKGKLIEGATIALGAMAPLSHDLNAQGLAKSDAKGNFKFEISRDSAPAIVAYHPEYAPSAAAIDPDSKDTPTLRIVLTPGGCVEGTLIRNGAAAANVLVLIKCERLSWQSTLTNDQGRYEFANVPEGTVELLTQDSKCEVEIATGQTALVNMELGASN
jgi:protocatechuate 3,4-dioxygenase beta subunit